ncbi:GTP cyclohydrolase II [Candidatus Woesearchaeota archaeon]|nr:GTP cyclohydrolase II [Candidatus Woesearchaeota archaeon]
MVKILRSAEAFLPTPYGDFKVIVYECDDRHEHLALIKGGVKGKANVLVRVHSECLTGDVLSSKRCDCHRQLVASLGIIGKQDGVLLYLRQEGRGIGLLNKIKAYALQDKGMDTVDANIHLGFKADERDYRIGAAILKDLGITSISLLTNNPGKVSELESNGINIGERVPLPVKPTEYTKKYLDTKKKKLGHIF